MLASHRRLLDDHHRPSAHGHDWSRPEEKLKALHWWFAAYLCQNQTQVISRYLSCVRNQGWTWKMNDNGMFRGFCPSGTYLRTLVARELFWWQCLVGEIYPTVGEWTQLRQAINWVHFLISWNEQMPSSCSTWINWIDVKFVFPLNKVERWNDLGAHRRRVEAGCFSIASDAGHGTGLWVQFLMQLPSKFLICHDFKIKFGHDCQPTYHNCSAHLGQ